MDGGAGGPGSGDNAPTTEALFVALGAGVTALSHPLLYVKLLIQVGPGGAAGVCRWDVRCRGAGRGPRDVSDRRGVGRYLEVQGGSEGT